MKFHSTLLPDEYVLALLNSSYISYYVKHYITNTRTLQVNDGKLIPIMVSDETTTNALVALVKEIISLKRAGYESRSDNDRTRIEQQIREKESKLDDIVFGVYGFDVTKDKSSIEAICGGQDQISD